MLVRLFWKLLKWGLGLTLLTLCLFVGLDAWFSRSLADLQPWHDGNQLNDFEHHQHSESYRFEDYLLDESALFKTFHKKRADYAKNNAFDWFRYQNEPHPLSLTFTRDWNQTQILEAPNPVGVFVMVHGLTDSPYSMRNLAERMVAAGYTVITLRLPGHGTIPGMLDKVDWRDWRAAVALVMAYADRSFPDLPLYYAGYSTGAALGLNWALENIDEPVLDRVKHLFLLSPALGINPFARFANLQRVVSHLNAFRKSRWLDITPEYDPYKYNSFPKNASRQLATLLANIHSKLAWLNGEENARELPPITSFQSIVDQSVSTYDLIDLLYGVLKNPRSELVLFDINRSASMESFMAYSTKTLIARLTDMADKNWTLTWLANANPDTLQLEERRYTLHQEGVVRRDLDLFWPPQIFSLSHVALPFPPQDPVYGYAYQGPQPSRPNLGQIRVIGEKNVLRIPAGELIRLRSNPFFNYIEARMLEKLRPAE